LNSHKGCSRSKGGHVATVTTHRCPARPCAAEVPNRLLACPTHWFRLPADIRREVARTAHLPVNHPQRRIALMNAVNYWKDPAQ
jgi:hypothetical protein